ncbi:MAG: PA14 domain-containing protein, partial [Actinomycetota bacterium]|nr:PA14 domain-containing protein [Actinomycetota bacterium]
MAGPLGSRVLTRILAVVAAVTMVASVPEVARAAEAAEENRPAAARDLPPLPSEKPAERQVSEPTGDFTQSPNANGQVESLPDGPLPANFVKKDGARVISRTPKSTTYDNGDGTSTALIHTSPVNWRDRFGTWRAMDPRLVAAPGDRLANASGPVRVSFPTATGDHDLLQVSADEWKLGFRLAGAAAGRAGKVDGAKIRYGGVLGAGVDLDAQVTPTGVKEDIVLARPLDEGASAAFRFPMSLTGLTAKAHADGSIAFFDAGGDKVLEIPEGVAEDSSGDVVAGVPPASTPVRFRLVGPADAPTAVEVSVDPDWLADPARVYPVRIDPSVVFYAGRESGHWDAFVGSGCLDCNYNGNAQIDNNAYVDKIGKTRYNNGDWEFYSYLRYDLSALRGHRITQGIWNGFFYTANTYTDNVYTIWEAAGPWGDSTVTWRNKPDHFNGAVLGTTTGPDQWVSRDLTGWFQNWVDNPSANNGIVMDTQGLGYYFRMAAHESYAQGTDSYLRVTFDNTPANWPSPSQLSPAPGASVMTTTPTLSSPPMGDAEGDAVRYWFRVATSTDAEFGQTINSGWITTPSFTVPPESLQDGVTYYWKVFTWDGWGGATPVYSSWPPNALKVNLRLGDAGPSPFDTVGPAKVNLANGNVVVSTSSPTFTTAGGPVGLSYTYNSASPIPNGLNAAYYNDCNGATGFPAQPTLVRKDRAVDFNWGDASPAPGIVNADDFCVRWTGFITTPRTNRYCFQAARDDGIRVWINNTMVVDSWFDQYTPDPPWGSSASECIDLYANRTNSLTVELYERGGWAQARLWVGGPVGPFPVPSDWLSTTPRVLPWGWTLSAGGADLAYTEANVTSSSVVLVEPSGATHEYRKSPDGLAWVPEAGEDAVLTTAFEDGEGVYVVHAADGLTYTFNSTGRLKRAISASDAKSPAAPRYVFSGDSGRLAAIEDPLSGRRIALTYSEPNGTNVCPTPPSPFVEARNGMLCRVQYWDGTETNLYYNVYGHLSRIADPGGEVTDFAFDANGQIALVRDPLAADKVATNPAALDNDTTRTLIGYDPARRAASVTLPVPNAGAASPLPRPAHSYG